VHPTWANGDPLPGSGLSFGARITPESILARCGLWVADYHDSPEMPLGGERLAALAVCRRRERGPPRLRPDQQSGQGSRRPWISRPSWWPLIQGTV
jgi:hypothetical protein